MSTRASAWPRSANISGNKQKTSLFRSEKGKAPGRALFCLRRGRRTFLPQSGPGFSLRPEGADVSPQGEVLPAPHSLFGGAAATALLGRAASAASDAGSLWVRRPESISIKRGPAALCAAGNKRERAAGAVQERTRQGDNRGISAEMQCGTASRAARDLPARPVPRKTAGAPGMERPESIPLGSPPRTARRGMEPCSPVNPFFLDGGFWLGESASRKPGGGVGGAFYASGGTGGFVTPRRFFSGIARRHHLFLKKRWWGRPSFRPEGGISCPAPCAELLFPAWDHAPRSRGNPAVQ